MNNRRIILSAVLSICSVTTAIAAPVSHGRRGSPAATASGPTTGWTASHCGQEPAPPRVEGGTVERYNASVDRVSAYDQAARSFNSCVSREAVAQQTAASEDARNRIAAIQAGSGAVRNRIAANFQSLSAQLKQANEKLGAKR
ncbi:hypothetical protein [Rhizosaccharibacter radicis]|uniref:Uncharacterized protein n=1 Tax=Rhizosaccharibacter radicis TaxID=2782605 RepID=A0ABT1VYA5_9PROT|nr:hypothetical protein [Acetobacteraceae bacterium KSS12]